MSPCKNPTLVLTHFWLTSLRRHTLDFSEDILLLLLSANFPVLPVLFSFTLLAASMCFNPPPPLIRAESSKNLPKKCRRPVCLQWLQPKEVTGLSWQWEGSDWWLYLVYFVSVFHWHLFTYLFFHLFMIYNSVLYLFLYLFIYLFIRF